MFTPVPLLLGIVMSIVHYFSEYATTKLKRHSGKILSFTGGISITYVLIELFPQFSTGIAEISRALILSVLVGFVVFHVVEKYIYQHTSRAKRHKELALEDSITSFIYHFIVGLLIVVTYTQFAPLTAILFFIPVLVYTAASTLPVDPPKHQSMKIVLALSTTLGVILGYFVDTFITLPVYYTLLGLIIGVLLYTTTRHALPYGKKGQPLMFFLGCLLYVIAIVLTQWI